MPDDGPSPPDALPDDLVAALEGRPPEVLRAVAEYADALAARRGRSLVSDSDDDPATGGETDGEGADAGPDDGRPASPPAGVPAKATLTVKEINDNRYYYWQWREGDRVKSKYARPVDPSDP